MIRCTAAFISSNRERRTDRLTEKPTKISMDRSAAAASETHRQRGGVVSLVSRTRHEATRALLSYPW